MTLMSGAVLCAGLPAIFALKTMCSMVEFKRSILEPLLDAQKRLYHHDFSRNKKIDNSFMLIRNPSDSLSSTALPDRTPRGLLMTLMSGAVLCAGLPAIFALKTMEKM